MSDRRLKPISEMTTAEAADHMSRYHGIPGHSATASHARAHAVYTSTIDHGHRSPRI